MFVLLGESDGIYDEPVLVRLPFSEEPVKRRRYPQTAPQRNRLQCRTRPVRRRELKRKCRIARLARMSSKNRPFGERCGGEEIGGEFVVRRRRRLEARARGAPDKADRVLPQVEAVKP